MPSTSCKHPLRPPALSRRTVGKAVVATGLGAALPTLAAPRAAADNTFHEVLNLAVTLPPTGWPSPPSAPKVVSDGYLGSLVVGPDDIPLTLLNGQRVIHPTVLGNYLNGLLDSIESTGGRQPANLERVTTTLDALMARATKRRGAAFLRYEFDWHSYLGELPAPWYSSFGQSKFPRVAHRLWRITGDRRWLSTTDQLVSAFLQGPLVEAPGEPWVAAVDPNHYLWLDEYPHPTGRISAVYNGHYYALYELLAYHQLSGDSRALRLVSGAAATMAAYRNLCRNPGRFSHYYASNTANVASYHYVNTSCYLGMYNLTGWAPFAHTVDAMIGDWRFTEGAGTLRLQAGHAHTVRPVTGTTGVNAGTARSWTPSSELRVSSSARAQWTAFPGVWSKMDDGPMAGHWVLETTRAHREGFTTDRCDYRFPRPVWFEPGTVTGYATDSRGALRVALRRTISTRSRAHSTLRAKVSGAQWARIDDGAFAGLWVPLNNRTHF